MNAMKYKGYYAKVEFVSEDRIFVGHIIGIKDIVGFHGESVSELEQSFHEAVDNYLSACASIGQQPDRPYSGRLTLRLSPEVHAAVVAAAETTNTSVNKWVVDTLKNATHA
ncbi:type II toxin-antitoxin system HicB family antitoxin [Desulfovibrio psychrotolerans]|uniref:Antitoxin HicB n=1 Tax=Desulfovibrio psychrotolerans TaxID=415242 RepID=A0A7J0BRQ3_9BACT|nr:type II toxin-antitoxin system HicB family antitoxin [Desulfovibrio psychrotolerans]GFM35911.1 antitoxin HicB [Desulfovibrio psychrotolerans]